MTIHIDIGGEGRYPAAINVNPSWLTSNSPQQPIPNLVVGTAEQLPFAAASIDLLSLESAPIRPGAADEIARVLKPGGVAHLLHPTSYAIGAGAHDAVAGALGTHLAERTTTASGDMTLTILRRAVSLLR